MLFRKEYKKRNILLLFYIIFGIVLLITYFMPGSDSMQPGSLREFSNGWKYTVEEDKAILYAEYVITEELAGESVMFFSYDSYVDACIDGEEIYHFGEEPIVGKSPGSYYHFMDIPKGTVGKRLQITIQTVYPHKFLSEYTFYMGNEGEMIWTLIYKELFNIVTNIIMLIFGVVMCMLHFIGNRAMLRRGTSLYLGLMAITFVVWSTTSLFAIQLIFHNAIFQYYLTYLSLYILSLLFILHVDSISTVMNCRVEFIISTLVVLAGCGMHFLGIRDFTENTYFFSIATGCNLAYMIIRIIKYIRKDRELRIGLFILCGFVMLNLLEFLFRSTFGYHSRFMRIGLLIYILVSVHSGIQQMLQEMAMVKEAAMLKTIAYRDNLTKIGNRYAFERDLKDVNLKNLSVVSLDLNNLKNCNDEFGHACGDKFIKAASEVLHKVYGERIYRIGGDEFVALLEKATEEEMEAKRWNLQENLRGYNFEDGCTIKLEIACGYASYVEGDSSYEDILKRADADMYCNKKLLKKSS
ncbi:MAG: GGDEF domain-containing protein [Lachnospiraceae bacterium]|nr:GGDEF domain-containing protein [Lachnospiraceae bacterium]